MILVVWIMRVESLANHLLAKYGLSARRVYEINRTDTLASAVFHKLSNVKGIIFFKDIDGFRGGVGDHIDLWDGRQATGGAYFDSAMAVWFWEIKY